jgi:protoheme IX farnesyltransferase
MTQTTASKTHKATWRDYLDLCKLRVVLLMLITSYVGMSLAAPGLVPWQALVFGLLGIGLLACAAAAVNHLVDRRIDALMGRTRHRPIPTGRVSIANAIIFASILGLLGFFMLGFLVNWLTAILTALTLVGYAGIYTMYLKRATSQNIVIGGLAGAMPPLLGWTAVTGHMSIDGWLLVLIIFLWTPPHFWALAIFRNEEYKKVDIPMLPTTHGLTYTRNSILIYTVLLLIISTLPYFIGMSGLLYLIGAIILGTIFLAYAIILRISPDIHWGMKTFRYSIIYLLLLFVVMFIDHYLF